MLVSVETGVAGFGSCFVSVSWDMLTVADQDFECIAVQMDHTADVKAVAWHPKEEVSVLWPG